MIDHIAAERLIEKRRAEGKAGNTAPQIIRTVEELEALDPDMVLLNRNEDEDESEGVLTVQELLSCGKIYRAKWLPAVVVAPAEQVRAARKALEEA